MIQAHKGHPAGLQITSKYPPVHLLSLSYHHRCSPPQRNYWISQTVGPSSIQAPIEDIKF